MSQSILINPEIHTTPKTLLSLNIQNVDDLFPGFAPGDFAAIYGSPSVISMMSLLCIRAQLNPQLGGLSSNVLLIDAGNTFSLYQVAALAKLHHIDPELALNNIYISRAFTAYQMTALIMERLQKAVEKYQTKLVIISDIAGCFLDKDISDEEARRVFSQVAAYLQSFARKNQVIVVATYLPRQKSSRNIYLQTVTCSKANVVLALNQTIYDREFTLEKHPYFLLGSAEYPSENLKLTDFM